MFKQRADLEAYIAKMLNVPLEDLSGYQDSLLDFGIDSVQIMGFVEQLQNAGINVSFIQMAEHVTLPSWWAFIESSLKEAVN
jgi:bifunctional isochorismate lyase/aryl carrier protein